MLRCSRSMLLLLLLLTSGADPASRAAAPEVPTRITSVRQLLELPPEIADTRIPVDVTGVILYFSIALALLRGTIL